MTVQLRRWSSSSSAAASATGSSNTPSRRAGRGYWNVHHEVVTRKKSLPEVFARLKTEKQLRSLKASSVRQAIDMFYFHCVQQAQTLDTAFRADVIQYFDDELFQAHDPETQRAFVLGESLNEAVFGAVIKLHLSQHDAAAAWRVVDKLHAVARAKLHFRTVGAILEHECRSGHFATAYARWQALKAGDVGWTTAMEGVLVQMVIACHAAHYTRRETTAGEYHAQMAALLHDVQLACKEVSGASAQRLRQAFHDTGYSVKTLPSDHAMCPTCMACGEALAKLDVSSAERTQLLRAIESRESKVMKDGVTANEFLAPFKRWLLAKHAPAPGKLHYVLDGPNIAYINQNFDAGSCRLDHIDAVATMLQGAGHQVSITMPFSYLADRIVLRIRTKKTKAQHRQGKFTTRQRTADEKALIDKWQAQGLLFSCRTDCISDDLFWLYASVLLGKDGRVVTNDQGRDHVFALLNSAVSKGAAKGDKRSSDAPQVISMDLIERWKERSIVNIAIQHEEVASEALETPASGAKIPIDEIRLLHPLPFSRVPQVTAPEHFHFPISSSDSLSASSSSSSGASSAKHARKKWLCAHRKASASTAGVTKSAHAQRA